MVALVWCNWVALFESVGLVTQKAIRSAAAPMNAFAVYYDRDDLNVSKRAQRNGEASILFPMLVGSTGRRRRLSVRWILAGNAIAAIDVSFDTHSGLKFDIAPHPKSANRRLIHRSKRYCCRPDRSGPELAAARQKANNTKMRGVRQLTDVPRIRH
jgi:hypothetical protein